MRCPSCDQANFTLGEPCPACGFTGEPALVEELARIDWLLDEIAAWQLPDKAAQAAIRGQYQARQRELEIRLGLRLPPFSPAEAEKAWPELFQRETLRRELARWQKTDLLQPAVAQKLIAQVEEQIADLLEQLEGHERPAYPQIDAERLAVVNFLFEALDYLSQNDGFVTPEAEERVCRPLQAQREALEIELGLRPELAAEVQPAVEVQPVAEPQPEPAAPSLPPSLTPPLPAVPRVPLRDRLQRTLFSERTLQALLILGPFLMFAAALSFVAGGWKDYSALWRVTFLVLFTIVFFGLGWYFRIKMRLYRTGIAWSAIAALFIPIDFYTVYVNFDIPPDYEPSFWLLTSLCCLVAYIVVTLIIRSQIFGYLVGTAAGSTALALAEVGHQVLGLSLDWRVAALSLLAAGFVVLATRLKPLFADPLRRMALLAAGILMPLSFGWRTIDRHVFDTLHYAMTVTWWVGGFILGWGAVYHRSRSLGLLAALSLPVATYMAQAAWFDRAGINPAWHALGWAGLVWLYFFAGHAWLARKDDPVLHAHGRTATVGGVVLLVAAALWSLTDLDSGAAAASSHAVLAGAVVLAALLWQRPGYLYGASLLSFSAATFAMTELGLEMSQLSLGWATLAIAHVIVAINVGNRPTQVAFAKPLVVAAYTIAALAILPPLFPYDGDGLIYALGNWLGLSAWGAWLAHRGQAGFPGLPARAGRSQVSGSPALRAGASVRSKLARQVPVFHWFTALPLPLWLWVLFIDHGWVGSSFPQILAALAWAMLALSYALARLERAYRWPWYLAGLAVSVAAPVAAQVAALRVVTLPACLLSAGLLYLADALANRQSWELAPGGLVTGWGLGLLLHRQGVGFDGVSLALALLVAVYILAGLWTERRRSPVFTVRFLAPLYLAAHLLSLAVLQRVYIRPLYDLVREIPWTDGMRMWGAANQLVLGLVYGLYAWGRYKERWGHVAAWLVAGGVGFVAIAYSQGRGSSAAKLALAVVAFVLAERALHWLRGSRPRSAWWISLVEARGASRRQLAYVRLAWRLYRRPLLVTGWIASAGVIGLALVRNLVLLGGGRIQQTWAVIGLLLITGLYALSARLFWRARFMALAAVLVFAPWTILTNLGFFAFDKPSTPGFAISWAVLAWLLFLAGLGLPHVRLPFHLASSPPRDMQPYARPLRWVAYVLLPFALLWGVADAATSRVSFGLAIAFYTLAAVLDYRRLKRSGGADWLPGRTRFLYPALGLLPIWCVYLLRGLLPAARHEHYGLLLLAFGPLGIAAGQGLERWIRTQFAASSQAEPSKIAAAYGLPAYLTGYVSLIVGTLLVAHEPALLALVLLYNVLLLLLSARLFRHPLWVYPAAALTPVSLLIALAEADVAANRHGWYLIGLAAVFMALAWALRRARLPAYATAALTAGFALIALGLPPSSRDRDGALWGYGGAALLYALTAAWLRQPLLLTPACALFIVPYAIGLQKLHVAAAYHGLALFPAALVALAAGFGLDRRLGDWRDFPWGDPLRWGPALAERLLGWWALPLYGLGFGLAAASPFFTDSQSGLTALNWLLAAPLFAWAIYRFRLRGWLLLTTLAAHLAGLYFLIELGWWRYPSYAWLRFLPFTLVTAILAAFIEHRRHEGSPLDPKHIFDGWSRPLYLMAAADIVAAQAGSLTRTEAGAIVTLVHTLLIAGLASFWQTAWLPYVSTGLGVVALLQWLSTMDGPIEGLPMTLALLALVYGLAGYAIEFYLSRNTQYAIRNIPIPEAQRSGTQYASRFMLWRLPLQRSGVWLSFAVLALTAWLGVDLAAWSVRALFGFSFRQIVEMPVAQMWVSVLAQLGLLYVGAAFTHRRLRLGYVAVGMLLAAWALHAFYVQQWDGAARVQWYALPAGVYLLGIAYLEWERGHRGLSRWLDYAALLLMMGSLFWQTLLFGWHYALLLGGEGFAAMWWGSFRRVRRVFYAGMLGVMLAVVAQLLNSLQSINQWIVFGVIGLIVVFVAALIERRLEAIKAWLEVLETWE
ncbi:MAG: hypothetical protein JW850_16390 [Thermoflexales bacterium]|nr:hypothetical protein [Thermoflexales bacterium]